jgi:hypothetical protein
MATPKLGEVLSRVDEAYVTEQKWLGYVLSDEGHGSDWLRVFGSVDADQLWLAVRAPSATAR